MECSLVSFLTSGRLGYLAIGLPKAEVRDCLGDPAWWQGYLQMESDSSDIWTYNKLEVVFSDTDLVAILRLSFRPIATDPAFSQSWDYSPLRFVDTEPHRIADLTRFLGFLCSMGIPHDISRDIVNIVIVITPGAVARFREVSRSDEHQSTGDDTGPLRLYLISISSGTLEIFNK